MNYLPPRSRKHQAFYQLRWVKAQAPTFKAKAGFAFAGDDPRRFLRDLRARPEICQSSRMQPMASAHSTGSPIATRLFAESRSFSRSIRVSCRHSPSKPFALPKEPPRTCLRPQTRVARQLSDNRQASITFASATSKCPRMLAEASILNSATSTRMPTFPPGRCLAGEVPQEEIEGRIILVGTSAPGLLDLRATPVDAAMPGIDIHAQVLEHLLTGKFLERPDYALALEEFVILLLGTCWRLLLPRVSAKSLRSHWFSHNRPRADRRMGRISSMARLARSLISSTGPGIHDQQSLPSTHINTVEAQRSQIRTPSANTLLPRWSSSWRNPRRSWC